MKRVIQKSLIIGACTLLLLMLQPFMLSSQIINSDRLPPARYYHLMPRVRNFKDMKSMKDVLHYNKLLLGQGIFNGNLTFNTGRALYEQKQPDGSIRFHKETRYALAFFTKVNITKDISLNATFFKDFNQRAVLPWTPQFTYSLTRYNWRPNTFNYGYQNYQFNKYSDSPAELLSKFFQGYFFISYHHKAPENFINYIRIDENTSIRLSYAFRYAFLYRDRDDHIYGGLFTGQPVTVISANYTLFWRIYVESSIHIYHFPDQQQAWDPDFTYGFGYFDWRPFRVSLTYGNWVVNRFPWNEKEIPPYGFVDGNFSISFNYSW